MAASAVVLPGCTGTAHGTDAPSSGDLTVLAAASLTESFTTIADRFERAHPGTRVTLSFGSSASLAGQVSAGAPADVLATASTATMDRVVKAGDASAPTVFASNTMTVVTPPDNPARVADLTDLARPDVTVAVCQAAVPCGVGVTTVFQRAGLTVRPTTEEKDVKAVLAKVTLGEVDAGLVYTTDATAAGDAVHSVPIAAADNATTSYPIAVLTHAEHAATARQFVEYVRSPDGRAVLADAGFGPP